MSKRGRRGSKGHTGATRNQHAKRANPIRAQIPRPKVTEYSAITVVPVFEYGDAGPPAGSQGNYDAFLILGVPAISGALTVINMDAALAGGDSLVVGTGLEVRIGRDDGPERVARIIPNDQGRLAQVRLTVAAENFADAEKQAYDQVVPVLSRIAFEADTSLDISGVLLTEQATQIRRFGAVMVGMVRPAPQFAGLMTQELRPLLAAYREGLNSNSPMYQALSFYKIIEHMSAVGKQRLRVAVRGGGSALDSLAQTIPADLKTLPDKTEWEREAFIPYAGMAFAAVRDSVVDTIRNAVAHLAPGRDVRSADLLDDVQACRQITPVLRHIARILISEEPRAAPPAP